jgi:hypothetical protein
LPDEAFSAALPALAAALPFLEADLEAGLLRRLVTVAMGVGPLLWAGL